MTALTALLTAAPTAAFADTAAEIEKANAFAMENFDLGDHAAARDQLKASVGKLDGAGMANSPLAAQTRALLGLVHSSLGDSAAATEQFTAAVRIAPDVTLDEKLATEAAVQLLEQARAAVVAEHTVDCATLIGIVHERVEAADAATPNAIKAHAGAELGGALVLSYANGDGAFTELALTKRSGCEYVGEIPADAVQAGTLEYFVVARNDAGKLMASGGSAASPFLIAVAAPADPGGSEATSGEGGEAVEDEIPDAIQAPKGPRKGGCAGCVTTGGDVDAGGVILLLGIALLLRRRRR